MTGIEKFELISINMSLQGITYIEDVKPVEQPSDLIGTGCG
jgi:hypothetical protein